MIVRVDLITIDQSKNRTAQMVTPQQQLQNLTQKFSEIQEKLQEVVDSRQKLESQSHENESVRAEFDNLDEDSAIYKLIGPVLVKQDSLEARQNVSRRIDLLKDETKKVEDEIKRLQGETEKVKNQIMKLQRENLAKEEESISTET